MLDDNPPAKAVPLVVDLDGTLTPADLAVESLARLISGKLGHSVKLPWAACGNVAWLKTKLARWDPVDPAGLPLRPQVIDLIRDARAKGRQVILASAAHQRQVKRVANHLGVFDHIIGSNARHNNKGKRKLGKIRALIGDQPFDYVGDSTADRVLWKQARHAYTVGVTTKADSEKRLMPQVRNSLAILAKASRPHQWSKNLLVFVPLVTAGLLNDPTSILLSIVAFVCLSILASGTYLLNDLLDIDADRAHPTKCKRPLASGTMSIPFAALAAALAIMGSLAVMFVANGPYGLLALGSYLALTLAYSFRLKSAMIVDVITLASLFTLRLIIGAAAIGVAVSFWLFLFSVFFFLSLGYVKRYVELARFTGEGHNLIKGRGYVRSDLDIVMLFGVASGMISLLVITLFANDMTHSDLYAAPQILWLLVLPLLYWLNRIWMMARRGQVDGDPVAFAIKDRRSWAVFSMIGLITLAAKFVTIPA